MNRAIESVRENLSSQPENQGLQNAGSRLRENQRRFESKHESGVKGRSDTTKDDSGGPAERAATIDRPTRAESVQRPERVARPERVERPERPERPERLERVERPEPPQRGHRR